MVYTITEVAKELGLHAQTIHHHVRELGLKKRGGIYLLSAADIAYIRERKGQAGKRLR